MTAPELLPCPFCGRAMEITDDLRHYNHPVSACFGRHISIAASDIDRIEMWNRRADLAAIQPAHVHPDPRDDVIARLVEALGDAQYGLSWAVRYFKDQDVAKDDPCPPCTRGLSATRAALAAAKEVHDA